MNFESWWGCQEPSFMALSGRIKRPLEYDKHLEPKYDFMRPKIFLDEGELSEILLNNAFSRKVKAKRKETDL